MSVIIQLQNLPLSASSVDIRNFFSGLNIPPGGVHIIGGKKGAAFIAFANDEDARQAMEKGGRRIKGARIKLALSSHRELKEVLEQLHKEQSEYEVSRKMTRSERNRSHMKHRRSRSRSHEHSRSHQEFTPDNQNSGGKYDVNLQRENPSMRQQSPYDRHSDRNVPYAENDKPNPYISSTYAPSDPEEERNEEIRRRIETFIATFGQAENYNLDLKKDTFPSKTSKKSHDGFPQPGDEAVHHNWSQGHPPMQIPAENYPSQVFDDFDTRRHFNDLRIENAVSTSEALQGIPVPGVNTMYNPLREQNERMPYSFDGQNFSSQTNHSTMGDRLLNSPMDIEEDKNNNIEIFQSNQYLGPHIFGNLKEMSKVQGESTSVSMGSAALNLLPFQNFENPGDSRLAVFEKGHPEVTPIDAAKDFCIKLDGLPYFATENDVRRIFRDQKIFDMFIPYTSDGKASGIGFVQFSSAEDLLAAAKMKYGMIGESCVEFHGSSRAALMEARMNSVSSLPNTELSSSFQDVLALKRAQDMLSGMISVRESTVSTSHPVLPPVYPAGSASYPVAPPSIQQQAGPLSKRSLCAVITGLHSNFNRHIQVLKCIENIGINFHLIHLVLNNRSRFIGKVFAEFHDLQDLDAALKKHNQNVEGCTVGVKQVLYEEMLKFLSSHRSRCMYPTPKQPDHLEKKPEKAPYIWEPPYEAQEKSLRRDTPAVWSSERAMKNQRLVMPADFYLQNNQSNRVHAFSRDFGIANSYGSNPYVGGSGYQKTVSDLDIHNRMNNPDTGNIYSGFNKANESSQAHAGFLEGNSEVNFSVRGNRGFISSRSREERGFKSRKNDSSASQFVRDKQRERSRSPIDRGLKQDFPSDYKRFRGEHSSAENPEAATWGLRSHTRPHPSQQKNQDTVTERKDEDRKLSEVKEAGSTPMKKKPSESAFPQKSSAKIQSPAEEKAKPKHEKVHGGKSSSESTSPKTHKKRFEHRKNCPKRQKNQNQETEMPVTDDHSKADDSRMFDDHPGPTKLSRSSDHSRLTDYVKSDRSRPIDRIKSDDRSRPIDRIKSDDRSRPVDRIKSDDRSRPIDRIKSDDRSRPSDRIKSDDRSRPSDRIKSDDWSRPADRPRPSDRSSRLDDRSRPNERSRYRSEQKELRKEIRDVLSPEELFKQPDCVLEATNVDPLVGLYELLDFFRGYDLRSENLIRRYTDTGEPTGDLRIAFHHTEDAKQAYKILNRQYLKGRAISLSFV